MPDVIPPTPPADPAKAPGSPGIVKKTSLTTPREIELQKKVSVLEDKVTGLESTMAEVNAFLADQGIGAKPKPVPVAKPKPADPAALLPPAKAANDVDAYLWG